MDMISTAIQKGDNVYVYNERNSVIFVRTGILHGYTGTTVSIKQSGRIYTYNENGGVVSVHSN